MPNICVALPMSVSCSVSGSKKEALELFLC